MKADVLFRIAAGLLIVFAAGHTIGFLSFRPSTPEGQAVLSSMNNVRFDGGFTYGAFYVAFGLFITLFFLLSAWLAWFTASLISVSISAARKLAWAMVATYAGALALAVCYFGPPQITMSALTLLCLTVATVRIPSPSVPAHAMRPSPVTTT